MPCGPRGIADLVVLGQDELRVTVAVDVEEVRGFRTHRGHHVVVIPVAQFAARIHEQMGGETGSGTETHNHQNVRPAVAGKVVNVTEKAVGVIAVLAQAGQVDGCGREELPRGGVIRSQVAEGACHHLVVAILVQVSGGDTLGVEEVGHLMNVRISGILH
jgi:hypothetical protein